MLLFVVTIYNWSYTESIMHRGGWKWRGWCHINAAQWNVIENVWNSSEIEKIRELRRRETIGNCRRDHFSFCCDVERYLLLLCSCLRAKGLRKTNFRCKNACGVECESLALILDFDCFEKLLLEYKSKKLKSNKDRRVLSKRHFP